MTFAGSHRSACTCCGAALSAVVAGGLCPACLIETAFVEDETDKPEGRWFGEYELLDELGRGGMGVVYRARQSELSRVVALKMVLPTHLHSAEDRARFHRETEAIASLDHSNILPIYDVGEHRGQPYFTMKLCRGSLAEELRSADCWARIPENAARLVADLSHAVHSAHERGIQHRDLKPSNVLLDADGRPLVSDFGLAKFRDQDTTLTLASTALGSPSYMAPEAARGDAREVTSAADLYSLGAILYELLAGRPPFQAGTALETMRLVVETEPVPPRRLVRSIPRDLETICLKCLRKNPADRYASARELAEDLESFLAGETVRARPGSTGERLWRWVRRRPVVAALLAVLAVGAVASVWQIDAARRAQARETARAEDISSELRKTNLALAGTNAQLGETIDLVELQRAEDLFRAGDSGEALSFLTNVLSRHPAHPIAGPRLASALLHGNYARPAGVPFQAGGQVVHLEMLQDGKTLFIATREGLTGFWDAASGEKRLAFEDAGHDLRYAKILGDGSLAAGWDAIGHLSLWNTASGERVPPEIQLGGGGHVREVSGAQRMPLDLENVWRLAFRPDGERIAASVGGTVRVWNARAAQPSFTLPRVPPPVQQIALSADGHWLAVVAGEGTIHRYDATNGHEVSSAMRQEGEIRSLRFSPDGRWLLSAGSDKTAWIWDMKTGEAAGQPLRHGDWINATIFSPDGARIATVSGDNTARIWETRTGRPLSQPLHHREQPLTAAFSLDGAYLYTAGADRMVRRWDVRPVGAPPALFAAAGRVNDAEFSHDGRLIATASEDGRACLWRADTLEPAWSVAAVSPAPSLVRFDPMDRWLAVAEGSTVKLHRINAPEALSLSFAHHGKVQDLSFSPNGRQLATASLDRTARIWNLDDGTAAAAPLVHTEPVASVRFSPDGHLLLTAETGKLAQLWDVRTGGRIGHAMSHPDDLNTAEFSAQGSLIATASTGDEARVWSVATTEQVCPPLHHGRSVEKVLFNPAGRLVATTSWDGTAQLWDPYTGRPIARAMRHGDHVVDVSFSPDGRRIATASKDQTARVWDTDTGLPITEPLQHAAAVRIVRFSPDGQRLLTISGDSKVSVWEVPDFMGNPPAWLASAAHALASERRAFDSAESDTAATQFAHAKGQAERDPGPGGYARLARWFFQRDGKGRF